METNINDALRGTKALAQQYKSVLALAEALQDIASLEQLETEARQAQQRAEIDKQAAESDLAAIGQQIEKAKTELQAVHDQAEADKQAAQQEVAALKYEANGLRDVCENLQREIGEREAALAEFKEKFAS